MTSTQYLTDVSTGVGIPLDSISFSVTICHTRLASICMTQFYSNSSDSALETEFSFPMDSDFAMSNIQIRFTDQDGKVTEV